MKEAAPRRIRYTITAVGVHQVGKLLLAITVLASLLPLTMLAIQGLLGGDVPSARCTGSHCTGEVVPL
jgi:hypothetical protein